MHRKGTFGALVAACALSMSGCGSSGSDGTDPVGAVPPPPSGGGETITVTGKVTDMPIPNATVVLTVAGQAFEAPLATDADGNYSVDIQSDDPDAMVLMEAFDPNGTVRFTALLDDFAGFQAEADAAGQAADKNITNVTTAHYLLASRAAADGSIDDTAELDESAALVDATAALELAAAIKLVVESIEGVALPGEYADTQALAEAIVDGTSTFLDDVAVTNPDALDNAVDLVINDGNATVAWNPDRVPGVYLERESFSIFAMFADGTGLASSYDRDAVVGFQWVVNSSGKLEVVYLTDSAETDIVTLLSHSGNVLSVTVEEAASDGTISDRDPSTVLHYPFADGFTEDNVPGTYSTLGEPGHLKVMLADHTGYDLELVTGAQGDAFFWELGADGVMWITEANDAEHTEVRVLGDADDGGMHLLVTDVDATGLASRLDVITVRRTDTIAVTPDDVDVADLTLAGNAYAFVDGDQIDVFDFRADGEVRQVAQHFGETAFELVDRRGDWRMVDDQTIRIWLDGQDHAEDARVVDGLGEDRMLVQTPEDIAEGTERVVERLVAVTLEEVLGTHYLSYETGETQNEYVAMYDDFTGEHWENGELESTFEWSLDDRGALVIRVLSDASFDSRTLTLRRLAGTASDGLRFVAVWRHNGLLTPEFDGDRAMTVLSFWRQDF